MFFHAIPNEPIASISIPIGDVRAVTKSVTVLMMISIAKASAMAFNASMI